MTKSELAYKFDTGLDPVFFVGSDSYALDDDDSVLYEYCCRIDDFPPEYVIDNNVHIPDPAYVRWLEEKVEELTALKK